uniref:DUF3644 domain-containing protein n=1 Tax=Marinobacter nauticus TaxID=2743 RepID=A0A455W8M6_MARNT|nr:hypothetical protein YBY_11950 [Marinobacter nauticus]
MSRIELDLLENALDSFNEALRQYERAEDGEYKAFKFCIQSLAHFFELLLKFYVTQSHPLLIYKNPFAKNIEESSQTIGLYEAVNFLKNEGAELPPEFISDLKWLKELRNKIEHHKFKMNVSEARETIGRLIHAVVVFDNNYATIDLASHIDEENAEVFYDLARTYEEQLEAALEKVKEAENQAYEGYRQKEYMLVDFGVYPCDECGHDTVVPNSDSSTGYQCTFCGAEECSSAEYTCGMCGSRWPKDDLSLIDWADTGNPEYYCPVCLRHPDYVKDD